jgi:hypothetical protein
MPVSYCTYEQKFPKLKDVHKKILSILWVGDQEVFPKPWISSNDLLTATGQKNFDRRIRALKSEIGCDIESGRDKNQHRYRLRSPNVLPVTNARGSLQKTKKLELFRKNKYKCNVCRKLTGSGVTGLQADHKIPLSRGGTNADENWQPLCNHCNAIKRSSCAGCIEDCLNCHWAFPEKTGRHSMYRVAPNILKPLEKHFGSKHEAEKAINVILDEYSLFIKSVNSI